MKYSVFILFGTFLIGLISCKHECEGFPDSSLKWIPYRLNDTIRYTDNIDSIEFVVIDFYKSGPTDYRGIYEIDCMTEAYYLTTKYKDYYQIKETCQYDTEMMIEIISMELFEFDIEDKISFNDSVKLRYLQDTIINSIKYYEVLIVSKDTINNSPNIAWIMKANDMGIIEFYDFKLKRKWRIINN